MPRLQFNIDEFPLFWQQLPDETLGDLKVLLQNHGLKAADERLTVLLPTNATGDFKPKPMVISMTKKKSLEGKGVGTPAFPILFQVNEKGWLTSKLFGRWVRTHLVPEIKAYMSRHGMPLKEKVWCWVGHRDVLVWVLFFLLSSDSYWWKSSRLAIYED